MIDSSSKEFSQWQLQRQPSGVPALLPRPIRRRAGSIGVFASEPAALMRGLGKSAAILAAMAAMAMAADVAVALPPLARWAIWATWIAIAAIGLVAGVVRPMVRRLAWNDLAALAEHGEPSLGERLTTAVSLLRQEPHGSTELIAAVVDDAAIRARQVDLTRAVPASRRLRGHGGGILAGLVISLAVVRPDPFANLSRASSSHGLTSIGSPAS